MTADLAIRLREATSVYMDATLTILLREAADAIDYYKSAADKMVLQVEELTEQRVERNARVAAAERVVEAARHIGGCEISNDHMVYGARELRLALGAYQKAYFGEVDRSGQVGVEVINPPVETPPMPAPTPQTHPYIDRIRGIAKPTDLNFSDRTEGE